MDVNSYVYHTNAMRNGLYGGGYGALGMAGLGLGAGRMGGYSGLGLGAGHMSGFMSPYSMSPYAARMSTMGLAGSYGGALPGGYGYGMNMRMGMSPFGGMGLSADPYTSSYLAGGSGMMPTMF